MELEEAQKKVATLSKELDARRPTISNRLDYFKGNTGQLRFASDKFKDYFEKRYTGFSDNWCMPVGQAPAERMNFLGVRPFGETEGVDENLQRIWETVDGTSGSSEAFLLFGVASRAFSLVHPADDVDRTPGLTWEHPESAIVETDPVTRRDRFGLVTWMDGTEDFATLYSPDEVWRFKRKSDREESDKRGAVDLSDGWKPIGDDAQQANVLGEVPLTELRNQTLLDDEPISDIDGVIALQDTANLIWAYLINGLDQASLPARVVTGAELPKIPVLDKNGQVVGYEDVELDELMKEKILWLKNADAKISEWSAGSLDVFSAVIERIVEHIAAQTRTPPHYLVAKLVNTAAESLNIAEAGLVSKTSERVTYANPGMKKTMRLLAKASGATDERIRGINAGRMVWSNIQYRSEAQLADAVGKLRSAGLPIQYIVERIAVDPAEVSRIMKMLEDERANDPLAAAQAAMRQGL